MKTKWPILAVILTAHRLAIAAEATSPAAPVASPGQPAAISATATAPASAPAASENTPATPAAQAPATRRGRGAANAPAVNHIETPATGAIWIPSTPTRTAAFGEYPYGPDSMVQEGVPQGTMEKYVVASKIFPGTARKVWVYVPAQYNANTPACLMVVQDGVRQYAVRQDQRNEGNTAEYRVPTVIDNLTNRGELPVIITVFVDPGSAVIPEVGRPRAENRSFEYDTLSDQYGQFIQQEILPLVAKYNIRQDAAGRCITGISSGAICAFTVAWNHPEWFGKVLSDVGSFTNINGGHVYPQIVRDAEKKPIKVFLQDGTNDNRNPDNPNRDWYLQNKLMYEALRDKGYEVRYVLGENIHGSKMGGPIFPDSMRWVWSDQVPKKDSATAETKPASVTPASRAPAAVAASPAAP